MSNSPHLGKFPCPNCELLFTFKCNLKRHIVRKHIQNHKQEERYKCAICHKEYSSKSYLKDHIRIVHRHEKTLAECKICFKKFSSRNAARDHERYMHHITYTSPVGMFTCDHCNKQFNKKHNMQVHIMYSRCNPFRIIRKKIQCPHCGVECLEKRAKVHIRTCEARKEMGLPLKPRRRRQKQTKQRLKVCSITKNTKRKTETVTFKNDTMLGENMDCLNISVKLECMDEKEMEDVSSSNTSAQKNLRRSNRKRKRVNYQLLDSGFAATDNELTQLGQPLGIQEAFRHDYYTVKLETTENYLESSVDMAEHKIDIVNWNLEAQPNSSLSISDDAGGLFRSNIKSKIPYSACEDFSKCTEVSLEGVLDNKIKENTEEINVKYEPSFNNENTPGVLLEEFKNEPVEISVKNEAITEIYENNNQNAEDVKKETIISSVLKEEMEIDLPTEIIKEEEELLELVPTDLATSEISQREHEDDASQKMKDVSFYKYLGII